MLLPTNKQMVGIFDPVVINVRKWLTATRVNGIRIYKQTGYRYPDSGLKMPFLQ